MIKQIKNSAKIQFLILTLILLSHIPLPHLILPAKPSLVLITIFYFSIIEQTRLPIPVLFVLGLFEDFLSFNMVGISSLSYVMVAMIASSNRRTLFKQKFLVIWFAFIITILLAKIMGIIAINIYSQMDYFKIANFYDVIITALIYPTLHAFYTKYLQAFRGE